MKTTGLHSVAWWCYEKLGLKRLIDFHTLHGWDVELAPEEHWAELKKHGVVNALSLILYPDGPPPFEIGFANKAEHGRVVAGTNALIDKTADAGFPSVIAFTGYGEPDDAARAACIEGLKLSAGHAEKKGVTLCLEHLNTLVSDHPMKGHPGYCGRNFSWVLDVVKSVGSPRVKILADAYHMQVMGGDLFRSYSLAAEYLGHVHVAGHPGRCALNRVQEIHFANLAQHLKTIGYNGYIGQEWIPEDGRAEPLIVQDLEESVAMCSVR